MDVFRHQMRERRDALGMTTQQLADRLEDLGMPLSATTITKIEKDHRGVALDEALAVAVALGVPLPLLLTPSSWEEDYPITPRMEVPPGRALNWLVRGEPLGDTDIQRWRSGAEPLQSFLEAADAAQEAQRAETAYQSAVARGSQQADNAHALFIAAVRRLRRILDSQQRAGVRRSGWWPDGYDDALIQAEATEAKGEEQP